MDDLTKKMLDELTGEWERATLQMREAKERLQKGAVKE